MNDKTQRIVALYKAGFSTRQVGERVGMTHGGVNWVLRNAGVKLRMANTGRDYCPIKDCLDRDNGDSRVRYELSNHAAYRREVYGDARY